MATMHGSKDAPGPCHHDSPQRPERRGPRETAKAGKLARCCRRKKEEAGTSRSPDGDEAAQKAPSSQRRRDRAAVDVERVIRLQGTRDDVLYPWAMINQPRSQHQRMPRWLTLERSAQRTDDTRTKTKAKAETRKQRQKAESNEAEIRKFAGERCRWPVAGAWGPSTIIHRPL